VGLPSHVSTASAMAVTAKIMICVGVMTASPMAMGVLGNNGGNDL